MIDTKKLHETVSEVVSMLQGERSFPAAIGQYVNAAPSVLELLDELDRAREERDAAREKVKELEARLIKLSPERKFIGGPRRLKPKAKPGQTVCDHGNPDADFIPVSDNCVLGNLAPEPLSEEFEQVFKEKWKDILA